LSRRRIVVIGASAGGVEALRETVGSFPADFPAPILVVLHVPAYQPSALPEILSRSGPLRASHALDGEKLKRGQIYVAPPDHHLLLHGQSIAVTRGPKENRFRPSIDALFRSAAYTHGPRAIGIVLSGALDDGTSGLWSIKRLGGLAIVQRPSEARHDSMPTSAIQQVEVDYTVPAGEIGPLVSRLVADKPRAAPRGTRGDQKRMQIEVAIATEDAAFQKDMMKLGDPSPFTCPECHGVLFRIQEQKTARFRCHTGHAYTESSLIEGGMESTGEMLWQVMRSYEEAVMMLQDMALHLKEAGDSKRASVCLAKARDLEKRSRKMSAIVLEHESLSADNLDAAPARLFARK
jgi:two-component system chemotaxis response regulator CheB